MELSEYISQKQKEIQQKQEELDIQNTNLKKNTKILQFTHANNINTELEYRHKDIDIITYDTTLCKKISDYEIKQIKEIHEPDHFDEDIDTHTIFDFYTKIGQGILYIRIPSQEEFILNNKIFTNSYQKRTKDNHGCVFEFTKETRIHGPTIEEIMYVYTKTGISNKLLQKLEQNIIQLRNQYPTQEETNRKYN